MIQIRRANDRGHANHGWLDTHHSFSFGDYYDPNHRLDFSDTGELLHILGLGEMGIDGFRERFLEAPRPCPLPRLAADSGDGWTCPLFRVPVMPGASAEPVLLAATAVKRVSLRS